MLRNFFSLIIILLFIQSVKSQEIEYELKGHFFTVYSVDFLGNDSLIITASWDKNLKLWDKNGNNIRTFQGGTFPYFCARFSPDGKSIVSSGKFKTIIVWDTNSGFVKFRLIGHSTWIYSVAYSNNGKYIASADIDGNVFIWKAKNGDLVNKAKIHSEGIRKLKFSPDDKYLARHQATKR